MLVSQWVYPEHNEQAHKTIIDEFQIHPVIAQILISRGIKDPTEIHQFFYAKLPNLYDPHLISDMDIAVKRILSAYEASENILIYGDNDVDGMTAAALLTEFLKEIGANVFFHVPVRVSLKQNLIGNALEIAKKFHCSLIITVDCGITAAKEIQEMAANGIDVIVTDHHEPTSKIPNCVATLNPKRIHSAYPNRDLTGVGVAFKLAHAITNVLTDQGAISSTQIDLKKYLDLVALGTIADMGALLGENRILVRYGLKQMSKMERIGLSQLFVTSEIEQGSITAIDIASKIAPRLNSLGRISDPIHGVKLLLLTEKIQAEELCKELDIHNLNRQRIEKEAVTQIEELLEKSPEIFTEKAVVLQSDKWHPGIIAILAARISKQMNRPTLILSIENGIGKGSLRTTPEFPLLAILKDNQDLLLNFGGHDFAAGLTILEENIETFKKNFIEAAQRCLNEKDMQPKLYLDAHVQFEELTFELIDSFSLLEPFGNENPPPLLYCDVVQTWPPKVIGQDHLKLFFEQNGRELEGMAFGLAYRKNELRGRNIPLKIAFTPHINTFLNKTSIQLQIKDFQIMNKSNNQ